MKHLNFPRLFINYEFEYLYSMMSLVNFVTSEINMCQSCLYNHIILALVKCDTKPTMTLSIWNKTFAFYLHVWLFATWTPKNIGSANHKSANCYICGRTQILKKCFMSPNVPIYTFSYRTGLFCTVLPISRVVSFCRPPIDYI